MAGTGTKKWLPRNCGGRVRELPNGKFQGQLALPGNRYVGIGTWDDGLTAAGKVIDALASAKAMGGDVELYVRAERETAEYVATQGMDRPPGAPFTLRWWGDKWLESAKRFGIEGVIENYGVWSNDRSMLTHYVYPFLGDRLVLSLTYDDFYVWMEKLKKTPRRDGRPGLVTPSTIKNVHKLVRRILKAAVQRRAIPGLDRSPLETGLATPKVIKRQMSFPEIEEFRRIVDATPSDWAKDLMIWQCFCGLRLGESLGLGYDDILDAGVMVNKQLQTDRKVKYRGPTKDHAERLQPLALPARQALDRQLERWPDTGVRFPKFAVITDPAALVWRSERGKFLTRTRWNDVWHTAREKAGVRHCRPHDLRRAFGNYLIDQGVEIRVVQILLGHADVSTTERYLGRSTRRATAAVHALDSYLSGEPQPTSGAIEHAQVILGELVS